MLFEFCFFAARLEPAPTTSVRASTVAVTNFFIVSPISPSGFSAEPTRVCHDNRNGCANSKKSKPHRFHASSALKSPVRCGVPAPRSKPPQKGAAKAASGFGLKTEGGRGLPLPPPAFIFLFNLPKTDLRPTDDDGADDVHLITFLLGGGDGVVGSVPPVVRARVRLVTRRAARLCRVKPCLRVPAEPIPEEDAMLPAGVPHAEVKAQPLLLRGREDDVAPFVVFEVDNNRLLRQLDGRLARADEAHVVEQGGVDVGLDAPHHPEALRDGLLDRGVAELRLCFVRPPHRVVARRHLPHHPLAQPPQGFVELVWARRLHSRALEVGHGRVEALRALRPLVVDALGRQLHTERLRVEFEDGPAALRGVCGARVVPGRRPAGWAARGARRGAYSAQCPSPLTRRWARRAALRSFV